MIAPEPPHHLREHRSALLLAVPADAPGVIHVVPLLRERLHQAYVLKKPVARLVVSAIADAAIVVPAVLQKNADRLLVVLSNDPGVRMSAAQVREAADDAEHLA